MCSVLQPEPGQLNKFSLSGKVAIVTGAARGIGKSIALAFAEAGADIVIDDRKLEDMEEVVSEISKLGRQVLPVAANLRHLEEIDRLVKETMDRFGRIDVLANNVGTNAVFGSVFDVDEKAWDITLGVNLKGYFFLSQAVGKVMKEKGAGAIVNISSCGGIKPDIGSGVYCISKAGVIMLTQVLAQEWGQYNIRVNAIAPGRTKTRFSQVIWSDPATLSEYEEDIALGRWAEPQEMAGAALFLASDAASYITGQTLSVDGGMYASVKAQLEKIQK